MDQAQASPDPEIQFRLETELNEMGQGDITTETIPDELPQQILSKNEMSQNRLSPIHEPFHRPNYAIPPEFVPQGLQRNRPDSCHNEYSMPMIPMPSPSTPHYPNLRPDQYHGHESWEEYISQFEDCAELGRWRAKDKVLFLASSLRGSARNFYMSLSNEEKRDYNLLITKLSHRFGISKHQNRWLSRLEMRKREPGESIAALGDDVRQMAQKAYCDLGPRAQEALALNQLYKIISLDMKVRCIDKECTTVIEAVDVIERYEALLGESNDKKKPVRMIRHNNDQQRSPNRYHEKAQNSSLDQTLKTLVVRLERLENSIKNRGQSYQPNKKYSTNRSCYICQSPEHFFRDCEIYNKCQNDQNSSGPAQGTRSQTQKSTAQSQGNETPSFQ